MNTPPVLFLVFNRPDLAHQSFEAIRAARPPRLFVAADGPRAERPGESELCQEVRRISTAVDWPCTVKKLFRDSNLGCELAVSRAITWFFEHVESGIILEDDCIPDPSFFQFAASLLERYKHDNRIMVITGNNFQKGKRRASSDYYFSKYPHCWGWATWRRAWAKYDHSMEAKSLKEVASTYGATSEETAYWLKRFRDVKDNNLNTWGYRWTFSVWAAGGLTATPACNLVSNVGFDERATHTRSGTSVTSQAMEVTAHPQRVIRNKKADAYVAQHTFGIYRPTVTQSIRFKLGMIKQMILNRFKGDHVGEK